MVLSGELMLVGDHGEERLGPGDCAAFKAGDAEGHHLINRSAMDAIVLEIGNRNDACDRVVYADIDMVAEPGEKGYRRRDGTRHES
jgi:uncharacterized cupin superfamily protein